MTDPHAVDAHTEEQRTKRYGRRMRAAGISICVGTALGAQGVAIAAEDEVFDNRPGQLFAMLTFISLMALGSALTVVGSIERNMRPSRTRLRRNAEAIAEVHTLVEQLITEHRAQCRTIEDMVTSLAATVSAVDERLTALETAVDKVPAYPEGVIHGILLRQDSSESEER